MAYWGGSTSTYWDEDDWLEKGFFDSMFDQDMAGNLITAGPPVLQHRRLLLRPHRGHAARWLREVLLALYNLNGDPTLDPFTRQPIALDVGAPAVVPPVATDDFEVMVTDAAVGPVPLAMVGVSQNGALLGAGMTDDTGTATFPHRRPDRRLRPAGPGDGPQPPADRRDGDRGRRVGRRGDARPVGLPLRFHGPDRCLRRRSRGPGHDLGRAVGPALRRQHAGGAERGRRGMS